MSDAVRRYSTDAIGLCAAGAAGAGLWHGTIGWMGAAALLVFAALSLGYVRAIEIGDWIAVDTE